MVNTQKFLIFDFDRTLADLYREEYLLEELADEIRDHYGKYFEINDDYIKNHKDGYIVWFALHKVAEQVLSKGEAQRVNEKAEEFITALEMKQVKKVGLLEGVKDTLKSFKDNGIVLGVVSTNKTSPIEVSLREAGIFDLFDYVGGRPEPFSPDTIKPSPYPVNLAIEALKADKEVTWYIGDSLGDMEAAKSAGITAVGVCTGKNNENELKEAGADLVCDSVNDIVV